MLALLTRKKLVKPENKPKHGHDRYKASHLKVSDTVKLTRKLPVFTDKGSKQNNGSITDR